MSYLKNATGRAHHALRAPCRSRGVEDVERIGRLDRHAIVDRTGVDERVIAHRRCFFELI